MAGDINISTSLPKSEFSLNSLTIILDHFTKIYDNYFIMEDFNLKPHGKRWDTF